jgi:hypothetical protein
MSVDYEKVDLSGELNSLFKSHLTKESYSEWSRSLTRKDIFTAFSDFSFGTIEWRKELGRPSAASMADGFIVEFWRYQDIGYDREEGFRSIPTYSSMPVSTWDAQPDKEFFRVNYLVTGMVVGNLYVGGVRFARGKAGWPGLSGRFLTITPPQAYFEKTNELLLTKYVVDSGFIQAQILGW